MPIPILDHTRHLLSRYPVLFCDIWGVLHNGVREYACAGAALEAYRAGGGIVILLSNAPVPAAAVACILRDKGVRASSWDAICTSGDLTRAHIRERRFAAIYHIGPDRSASLFEGLDATLVDLDAAQAIVCTGLVDDRTETGDSYRPLLTSAATRMLPFVCANPDLVVEVGGHLLPCAGAIGRVYADIGGDVYWAGKPHPPAYALAFASAARLAGRAVAPGDVLAIGDAVATDLAGAAAADIAALFIAGGIHRGDVMGLDGVIDGKRLDAMLAARNATAVAAAPALVW